MEEPKAPLNTIFLKNIETTTPLSYK